jgi:hypothetical protein
MPGSPAERRVASAFGEADGLALPDGAALAEGAALADGPEEMIGPASSPSRGGPSAASLKMARAFQIIQPFASFAAAAANSASTCATLYGGKGP